MFSSSFCDMQCNLETRSPIIMQFVNTKVFVKEQLPVMFTFIILCDFISYQEEENNKGTEYILYVPFHFD